MTDLLIDSWKTEGTEGNQKQKQKVNSYQWFGRTLKFADQYMN